LLIFSYLVESLDGGATMIAGPKGPNRFTHSATALRII